LKRAEATADHGRGARPIYTVATMAGPIRCTALLVPALVTLSASPYAAVRQAPSPQPGAPAASAPSLAAGLDQRIVALVGAVSDTRLGETVRGLEKLGTRNTMSDQTSATRGVGAAAEWIAAQFREASPRLQVSFDTYELPPQGERVVRDVRLRNVMAVLPGRSPRRIYVSGHYDSLARAVTAASSGQPTASAGGGFDWGNADNTAPGANDDGSGTALVMELARAFAQSGIDFDATLVFMAFAGEEQGLVGARLHAQKAVAEKLPIDAVFNNDIVGNSTGGAGRVESGRVRVFSDGPEDSMSRQLARFIARQAARYVPAHGVSLVARYDRFGRGGDHIPFSQAGFAAVRFTEARENYARQHSVKDTSDGVDAAYLARNARSEAAAVAVMALAPPAPVVASERGQPMLTRQPSGYDATLRWKASPGATAYRIVWRDTWSMDWQHELVVGAVETLTLPDLSIDDVVFGVAAIGPGGHESLVSAYVNPSRPETPVKTK